MVTESFQLNPATLMIVPAKIEHLGDVKRLADGFKRELGFINRATLQKAIEAQCLLVALGQTAEDDPGGEPHQEGTELVGMVHFYVRRDQRITLYDIAVAQAYQKKGVGRLLFEALIEAAEALGKKQIRLKCPCDLPANQFYERLGLKLVSIEPGKQRPLNIWIYPLKDDP